MEITTEYVRELFTYNCLSGTLYWRKSLSRAIHIGDVAGCLGAKGYMKIRKTS